MIVENLFCAALSISVLRGATLFWLSGCTDIWYGGDRSGILRHSFLGVLKVCVPKVTGVIYAFITLILLSL